MRFSNGSLVNVSDIGAFGTAPYGLWHQATDGANLNATHPIVLNPNGGNVGIGTSNPGANLTVSSNSSALFRSSALTNRNNGNGTCTSLYKGFQADSGDPYGIRILQMGYPTATRSAQFAIQRLGPTGGDTDWLNSLFIDCNGNLGIGEGHPDAPLTVNSTVNATEVLIDQTVPIPDYVFD